ncbi:ABC-type amino acid transport/signal transduction system protein [Klebsiella pneumoniae]|uniref:ABC-type amino acid transport/signal transduction system protein n=1 Tax=Klebsiella pneumoniae TaxID=573 RepID=A0A377V047_KLEPN|nr:ABC-type amino acid transport/signal transduction system protein [Klebsiella pneumoniae]
MIDFSRAYAPFFLGVFGPKGAELKDAAALSGKKHRRDPWGGGRYGADQRGAAGGAD